MIEDMVVKHKSVHDRMLHDIFIVPNDNEGCLAHFRFAALPWNKDLNCCVGIRLCKLGYSGIIYCTVNTRKKLPQSITQEVFNFSNHLNGSIIRSRAGSDVMAAARNPPLWTTIIRMTMGWGRLTITRIRIVSQ